MLENISIYLGIGVIFMCFIEWVMKRGEKFEDFIQIERLIGVVGWPIFLIQYIINLIKILNGK